MKDRIKLFLEESGLTAAQMADKIGVQRSSFSHILNGRNKPSADFISKLLESYPDLNANWLFGNTESIWLNKPGKKSERNLFTENEPVKEIASQDDSSEVSQSKKPKSKDIIPKLPELPEGKRIEQIVFFFDDKSFIAYNPGE